MKPPKSYAEQVDILKSRGLTISNPTEAEQCLSRFNYYRLSVYGIPFQDPRDVFRPGTTFEQICQLYEFDRQLRLLIAEALEIIEIAVRTKVAYHFAHAYGAKGHEYDGNFPVSNERFSHVDWLKRLHDDIQDSKEVFIGHHKARYPEEFPSVPVWVAVEVMSLGSLSKFIGGMHFKDQKAIASSFSCTAAYFPNWLHVFTCIRNICAHHSRLWNKKTVKPLRLPDGDKNWDALERNKTGAVIFALCHVLHAIDKPTAASFSQRIKALINEPKPLPEVPRHMGFSDNWQAHPLWTPR